MTDKLDAIVNDIKEAINSKDNKQTKAYDTTAEVKRVDYETGTAWVHIPGGVDETPIKLTVNASVGDNVQVRVSGGSAWIVGNASAPPTDDKTAVKARSVATKAQETAEEAQETANSVEGIAQTASTNATTAINLAEGVNEHFWYNQTGAHVTEVTQEQYEQSPSTAGGNVLITSQGMAVRDGETELGSFTSSGIRVGRIGGNGVQIGTEVTSFTGHGGAEVLQIHQGASTPVQTSLVTDYALASGSTYTGTLPSGVMPSSEIIIEHKTLSQGFWWVVSYSVIQGTASTVTISSMTIDYDGASTIEVTNTDTEDCKLTIKYYSGAEASPYFTFGTRKGTAPYSMAIGEGIKLNSTNKGSLGLGKYNWEDNAAIVIGDGTGDANNQRDDIFKVDWTGGVYTKGYISTDGSITSYGDVLVNGSQSVSALFTDYIIEEGTQSSWEYRKWNSGKVEAWREITNSASAGSVWVSPLYYRDLTVSIPSGLFSSAPDVKATSTTNQWWVSYANATSATRLTYRLVKPVSSSQASGVSLYLYGE